MALTLDKIGKSKKLKSGPTSLSGNEKSLVMPWNAGELLDANKSDSEPSNPAVKSENSLVKPIESTFVSSKQVTNEEQTGNNPGAKRITNREQTGNKSPLVSPPFLLHSRSAEVPSSISREPRSDEILYSGDSAIRSKHGITSSEAIQKKQPFIPHVGESIEFHADKRVTNGEQTGNNQCGLKVTNGEQTGNIPVEDHSNFLPSKVQRVTQRVTAPPSNGLQTDNKEVTSSTFEHLKGYEQKLLQLIFFECQSSASLLTPPLTLERIAEILETRKGTAKTVIVRLVKKGLAHRERSATGRGGYTRFRIEKSLYNELLVRQTGNKQVTIREQTGNKQVSQRVTEQVTEVLSSSSSSLDLTLNKTSTSEKKTELIDGWQNIYFSELSQIGFGKAHIQQLAERGKRTPEEVQISIDAFAFDLTVNQKAPSIKNPLGYFMGILHRGPYAVPVNFEAPEVRQRKAYLAAEERKNAQLRELDERILQSEFEKWDRALELEEKLELAPVPEAVAPGGAAHKSILKEYFRENLWPVIENKIRESSF
jgi:predicted transcriptional regulator